jgi:hypothetical protein
MKRSKKIFIGVVLLFFIAIAYMSYDIGKRTTFPGSKSQLKERLKKQYTNPDTLALDSIMLDK